jgi:hypothetical protein
MKRIIPIFVFIALLTGCTGPATLQKELNMYRYPLGYIHDSPKQKLRAGINIVPKVISGFENNDLTLVTKDGSNYEYLIVVYNFSSDFTIVLGNKSVKPDLDDFIKQAFIKESERSGIYASGDSVFQDCYSLDIEILKCVVVTRYRQEVRQDITYSENNKMVRPAAGDMVLKATLVDPEGREMFSKNYEATASARYPGSNTETTIVLNKHLMQNMAETLSECIKICIADMVSDINGEVDKVRESPLSD